MGAATAQQWGCPVRYMRRTVEIVSLPGRVVALGGWVRSGSGSAGIASLIEAQGLWFRDHQLIQSQYDDDRKTHSYPGKQV